MFKEKIKVCWDPAASLFLIACPFHCLRYDAEALVARLPDGFKKATWLSLHFADFVSDPSGPVEVDQEGDLFILRNLAFPKNQKFWI